MDMPFAKIPIDKAPWDILMTAKELRNMLQGVTSINDLEGYHLALMIHWSQLSMVSETMTDQGFTNIMPIYWHKTEFQNSCQASELTSSVEIILLGKREASKGASAFYELPHNPKERHNFFECPARVTPLVREGHRVNVTQKPPSVAKWIMQRYGKPNTKALIFGSGAGGDVLGCLEAGLSCVAVDKDRAQFEALYGHLAMMKAEETASLKDDEDEEETKKLKGPNEDTVVECKVCGHNLEKKDEVACKTCEVMVHNGCMKSFTVDADGTQEKLCNTCYNDKMTKKPSGKNPSPVVAQTEPVADEAAK